MGPIVDQLYDNVPTLKSVSGCLNSLRVVSPGVQRRKSTRKDPVTRTESLVLTRFPPRTVADSVSIQWSSEVKPTLKEANDPLALVGTRERIPRA